MASFCLSLFLVFLAFTVPAYSEVVTGPFHRRALWAVEYVPPPPQFPVPPVVVAPPPPPSLADPPAQDTYVNVIIYNGGSDRHDIAFSAHLWILLGICVVLVLCSLCYCIYLRRDQSEESAPPVMGGSHRDMPHWRPTAPPMPEPPCPYYGYH